MISEKLVHSINLNVKNRLDDDYEYEEQKKLEEVVEILQDIDAHSVSFYNDPVGELTYSVMQKHNIDYYRMVNDHRISHSFAQKLFGLDKNKFCTGKTDAVVAQYFSLNELDKLFEESDKVILVSPAGIDQIDKVKYSIETFMYCAVVTKIDEIDEVDDE